MTNYRRIEEQRREERNYLLDLLEQVKGVHKGASHFMRPFFVVLIFAAVNALVLSFSMPVGSLESFAQTPIGSWIFCAIGLLGVFSGTAGAILLRESVLISRARRAIHSDKFKQAEDLLGRSVFTVWTGSLKK